MIGPKKNYYSQYRHFLKLKLSRVESFFTIKKWLKNKKKILDVGCGIGYLTNYWQAIGLDVNKAAVKTAGRLFPQTKFVQANAGQKLPFPSAYFDAVVCYNILEHLTPDQREHFFQEAKRILTNQGVFIAAYADETFWFNRLLARLIPNYGIKDPTHLVSWTPADFANEVSRHFTINQTKQTSQYGKLIFVTKYLKGERLILAVKPTDGRTKTKK